MSLNQINQIVSSLAKNMEDNEKIAIPVLAVKLARFVESFPHDQTLGAMSVVIDKMELNNNTFITKASFRNLYNKLYSRNTKFAELFQEELGLAEQESPITTFKRDDSSAIHTYEGDDILSNALNSVFDKTLPLKMYSQKLANSALKEVLSTLDSWNLKPGNLTIDQGSDKFLVLKADYETPKGITSFYVPVEIQNNKIVEANIFMGNAGPQELNHVNLKSYITSFAGDKLKISGSNILGVLTKAASENREISDVELAIIRLNGKKEGSSEFSQNQIVGQFVSDEAIKDVSLPKSDEFASFEEQFNSPYGMASYQFGENKVKSARDTVVRELIGYGYKNPQVSIVKSDDNTLFYGVSLDAGKVAFTVPVKINNGKLSSPNIMICNGSIASFSKESISELYTSNQTDYKVQATISPLFDVKPSDLINNIRDAVQEGNNAKAEDALNVLANSGDMKAYAMGFDIFKSALCNKEKIATASEKPNCSLIIKNNTSQHSLCGHTGLPLHKVYQDKHGNCQPLYRRGMDETYEGATFMNSKIFG